MKLNLVNNPIQVKCIVTIFLIITGGTKLECPTGYELLGCYITSWVIKSFVIIISVIKVIKVIIVIKNLPIFLIL